MNRDDLRTLITGDLHGGLERLSSKNCLLLKNSNVLADTVVIVTGDLSIPWKTITDKHGYTRMSKEDLFWVNFMENKRFTLAFVDGNHENFNALHALPECEMFGNRVRMVSRNIVWLQRGLDYHINGKHIFVMGGARSIDSSIRKPGVSWWPEETPSEKDIDTAHETIERIRSVDYVISHTCPTTISHGVLARSIGYLRNSVRIDITEYVLEDIRRKLQFKHWYFGHFHLNTQCDEKFTCIYNYVIPLGHDIYSGSKAVTDYNNLLREGV